MNQVSSSARKNLRLGYLALAHAAALFGLLGLVFSAGTGVARDRLFALWVGLVTLWFFWPLVLALHRGRSLLRFALFVFLGSALLWPSLRLYNVVAADVFGLPMGMNMNPVSAWKYSNAYLAGRNQARKDISAGILAIEDAGLVPGHESAGGRILRERYQIEMRSITGWIVDEKSLGHQAGYNSVSIREIDRRIGWDRVQAARGEGLQEEYARAEQLVKELTKRLSNIPPDAKVTTQWIRPYVDNQPLKDRTAEQRLAPFVRAVEQSVIDAVPEETPSFELRISAKLAPHSRPSFEMSGSLNPPQSVWQAISNKLETMPPPEWSEGSLSVAFEFLIRPPRG